MQILKVEWITKKYHHYHRHQQQQNVIGSHLIRIHWALKKKI